VIKQALPVILALGSLYALLGAGVVIVYRTSRILNFAVGELGIVSGYLFVMVAAATGSRLIIPSLIVFFVSCGIGLLIYILLMRPILGRPPFVGILMTVALGVLLQSVIVLVWGGRFEIVDLGGGGSVSPGGGWVISLADLRTFFGSTVTFVVIYILYETSRLGVRMRAVAENVTLAAQRGVNIDRMVAAAWMVALVAASVGGTLFGSRAILGVASAVVGIKGLTAALIGGLDSLKGAAIGGFVVAGAEYMTAQVSAQYTDLMPVVLLLLVLLVRPWGMFGTPEEVRRV
jgi:branched-chain amino acid transport system permease protein